MIFILTFAKNLWNVHAHIFLILVCTELVNLYTGSPTRLLSLSLSLPKEKVMYGLVRFGLSGER